MVIGFVLPPLATHVHYAHKGYSLYNVGFASGIIATVIVSLLKSFGIETKARQIWATGYDHLFLVLLSILFGGMILAGALARGEGDMGFLPADSADLRRVRNRLSGRRGRSLHHL